MQQAKTFLVSTSCLRQIFPNDIGSGNIIRHMAREGKIKPVKQKRVITNTHVMDNFKGAKKLTTFYRGDSILKVIDHALDTKFDYRTSTETKEGYKRLREAILKLKEIYENDTSTNS